MAISFDTESHISDDDAVALVEKRMTAAERERIDAHLDRCEDCRELLAAMAMASSVADSEVPVIDLDDSSGLDSLITPFADLDDSNPTQIYATHPPSDEGAPLEDGDHVDHFRIMRALGRGAMGEVYLARDTMLGRKVALKVIAADLLGSERAMRRFLFEAKATARFNHPNIVTIHAVGEHGDRPYVALEYVEGQTLRERTKDEPLPLPEILRIALAIADALAEAHAHGILHRDLKPANIIIGGDGRVRLLDFGLAKAVQAIDEEEPSSTSTSSSTWLVGTPRYMAPEQWRGGTVESTADVFALGVIVFELCAGGVRPFDAKNTVELLRVVTSSRPAPKLSTLADVPDALSDLVARCLEKDPSARPSAKDVADGLRVALQPERPTLSVTEDPFRGLLPFTERHASMFFGRDAEIAAFLERLRIQPVLPLLGPSGAGKTSLIQAGVIPRLRELGGWVVLQLRPGPRPFETLASRFERRDSGVFGFGPMTNEGGRTRSLQEVEARAEILRAAPRRLSVMLRELADAEDAKVLLFVDQLEEVFSMVDELDQKRFLEAVCTAADDAEEPVRVVLSLRHDFVDRLSTEGDLGSALSRFVVLKTPDKESLRQTLVEPVKRTGYKFEDDGLVDQIIAAVQGEPSCLPLIQFAAAQLWARRDDENKILLRSAYDEMGGVGGALAQHADSILDTLPADQRKVARTLLIRLVTPEKTRRLVPKKMALDGLGDHAEVVLKHLTEARLIGASKMRGSSELMLELAHATLIHTWTTFAEWIDHSEDELRTLHEATQAAELWDKRGRRATELWGDEALRDIDRTVKEGAANVPGLVRAFLDASRVHALGRARRRRLGLAGALGGLALICAIGVVAFIWISRSERQAELAHQRAAHLEQQAREQQARLLVHGARRAIRDGFPLEARAQVRRALELQDSAAARALWHALRQEPIRMRRQLLGEHHAVATSLDGSTVAVASGDGRIDLVNTTTAAIRHLDGHADAVTSVVFTPDGNGIVSGDREGNVILWDTADNSSRTLGAVDGGVNDIALSADGRFLATAAPTGVRVLELPAGKLRAPLTPGPISAVSYLPDGRLVVGAGDGSLSVYRGVEPQHATDLSGEITAIATSARGEVMAIGSGNDVVFLSAADVSLKRTHVVSGRVHSVALSVDGKRAAVAAANGSLVVFDVATGDTQLRHASAKPLRDVAFFDDRLAVVGDDQLFVVDARNVVPAARARVGGHSGFVHDVALAPDGRSLASAGADGTVRIWDAATGDVTRVLNEHAGPVNAVGFDSTGVLVAFGGGDHDVRLWNLDGTETPQRLRGHEAPITSLGFSADGTQLVSGSLDTTARTWDSSDGSSTRVLTGHGAAVNAVAYGPRDVIATGSQDGSLRLWPNFGAERSVAAHAGGVVSLAFHPTGSHLISAGNDRAIRRWPLAGSAASIDGDPSTIDAGRGRISSVAVHPSAERVAIARARSLIDWISLDGDTLEPWRGHLGSVNAIAFDRAGAVAASAGDDATVRVWDVASQRPRWRGVALLPGPARTLTHRGWETTDGTRYANESVLGRRLADAAQFATQAQPGGPVCLLTSDGAFELWRDGTAGGDTDAPVHRFEAALEDVVALPTACAARSVGAVHLVAQSGERRELAIGGAPLAIGWGEERLLVATDSEVIAFSESGEKIAQHQHELGAVTAITQIGSQLVLGHPQGSVTLIVTSDEAPSVARFAVASTAPTTRMMAGPRHTLVTGHGDGTLALFDTFDGALLVRSELHGAIYSLLRDDTGVAAATSLGDVLVWPLEFLTSDYCGLLRRVWAEVPVAWEQGRPALREPPGNHRCQ